MYPNLFLSNYISKLDKEIGLQGGLTKAHFLIETSQKIEGLVKANPQASEEYILKTIGPPSQQAQIFLIQNGLSKINTRFPWARLFLFIFLLFITFTITTSYVLYKSFTPLVNIDEKEGRIQLFGGKIDLNSSQFNLSYNSNHQNEISVKGSKSSPQPIQKLELPFKNGDIEIHFKKDFQGIAWDCRLSGEIDDSLEFIDPVFQSDSVLLDLTPFPSSVCNLTLPLNTRLQLNGSNAKVAISQPTAPVNIEVINGIISIDTEAKFDLKAKVTNGSIIGAENIFDENAPQMELKVVNGQILFTKK